MNPAPRPGLLGLSIAALSLLSAAVSALLAVQAWQAGVPDVPDLETAEASAQTALQLSCAVLTLIWLSGALRRVVRAGAEGLAVGPVGAVLWWFVPVANLIMPFKAFAELRKAAIRPADWQAVDGSALMWCWWGWWIVTGIANTVFLHSDFGTEPELVPLAGLASLTSDVAGTIASLLFALVVIGIDRRLEGLPDGMVHSRVAA